MQIIKHTGVYRSWADYNEYQELLEREFRENLKLIKRLKEEQDG